MDQNNGPINLSYYFIWVDFIKENKNLPNRQVRRFGIDLLISISSMSCLEIYLFLSKINMKNYQRVMLFTSLGLQVYNLNLDDINVVLNDGYN